MGSYQTYNTHYRDTLLFKVNSDLPPVLIPKETLMDLHLNPNTKYKVKKNDKLVAKVWTNDQGWIIKYKNYDETHVFIKVNYMMGGFDYQEQKKAPTSGVPSIFICKRKDKEHLETPIIV